MQQNLYDNETFFNQYRELRENPASYNVLLEQPALHRMLPPLAGKQVLDLGCGFGDGCVGYLALGAAHVTGIDLSQNMIETAQKNNPRAKITYICMDMTKIEDLQETFDVIISSLAIHYIRDFQGLADSVFRCLKPGGKFVFSQEHPLTTACSSYGNWQRDETGKCIYYKLDGYCRPGKRTVTWMDCTVQKYHRTFSQIISQLLCAGFQVEAMQEPVPTQENIRQVPRMYREYDKPSFLLLRAGKPAENMK